MPWTAIITAVVKGIIGPILQWWSTYWQGRNAQRVDDLEAARAMERKIDTELRKVPDSEFVLGPDGRVRRAGGTPDIPPAVPSGKESDPK